MGDQAYPLPLRVPKWAPAGKHPVTLHDEYTDTPRRQHRHCGYVVVWLTSDRSTADNGHSLLWSLSSLRPPRQDAKRDASIDNERSLLCAANCRCHTALRSWPVSVPSPSWCRPVCVHWLHALHTVSRTLHFMISALFCYRCDFSGI